MTSAVTLLIDRCGLSQREAAEFLDVRIDTVKSWGRVSKGNHPRPGVMEELRELYARIEFAAGETLGTLRDAEPDDRIELGLASDDAEARQIGWPCVGAQAAMFGIVIGRLPLVDIRVVPRGCTPATAAAADAHDAASPSRILRGD